MTLFTIAKYTTHSLLLVGMISAALSVSALSTLGTDFVGTTTNTDFILNQNNAERMRITSGGYIRIATSGGYFDYRPNNISCTAGQILSWDNTNTRWICANDAIGITGTSLTTNYVTKWDGSVLANSQIFDNGTNVGIGTATPGAKLDVMGVSRSLGSVIAGGVTEGGQLVLGYVGINPTGQANSTWNIDVDVSNSFRIFKQNSIGVASVPLYIQETTGNVGIGTATPAAKLDVSGDALINGVTVGRGSGNIVSNTANGASALQNNTTGIQNTANGIQALQYNTTGNYNTANGALALQNNTGSKNTAIGASALPVNISGNDNTAIGVSSLYRNTTGNGNIAIGTDAFNYNTTGGSNTAIGGGVMQSSISGNYNTAIGSQAGNNLVSGSSNIAIGFNTAFLSTTASNQLNIGNWIYGSGGNIGIGTNTPTAKLEVAGLIKSTNNGMAYLAGGDDATLNDVDVVNTVGVIGAQDITKGAIQLGNNAASYIAGSAGNIGIGIINPGSKLDVNGEITSSNLGAGGQFRAVYGNYGSIIRNDATDTYFLLTASGSPYGGWNTLRPIRISNAAGDVILNENIYSLNSGNVGIGTATPTAKLTVSGATMITGDLTVQGRVITDTLVNRTVQNLTVSGSLYPYATSSSKDIGATANRWANLWLSGNATIAGTVTAATFVGNLTGNATTATTLQNSRTINGVVFDGSANIALPTVNTSGDQTITGIKDFTTSLRVATPGGIWLTGMNGTQGINMLTPQSGGAYHPIMRQTTSGGHVVTLGGLGNQFGFYGYLSGRTLNGYDHFFGMDVATGNVGVGTVAPGAKLEVAGQIKVTGGTPGAGKVLTSDATGLASWTTPGAGVTGGQTNYIARWLSATTLGTGSIFDNGTNVGIGTATPGAKLDVSGNALINGVTVGKGSGSTGGSTAVGVQALYLNTTGDYNTAFGVYALTNNTTGWFNVAHGDSTLHYNTTGNYNTANGASSLANNSIGSYNTANGGYSLRANTTGNYNTANGYEALNANNIGTYNTANGYLSLYSNTWGSSNTANGTFALMQNITGSYNTANGRQALGNSTGNQNTANGYAAGNNLTSGDYNIAIGANTIFPSTTASNQLNIGNWIYGDGGNIGIGTSTALTAKLTVAGQLKITGGVPGAGKVLTSDATGLASWTTPASGAGYPCTPTGGDLNSSCYGAYSLQANTSGYGNAANGVWALYLNTTGGSNAANGTQAMYSNTTGYGNTANGYSAMFTNNVGFNNAANGMNSLYNNTNGSYNSAAGYMSLYSNNTGIGNSGLGYFSLGGTTSGQYNVGIGYSAGSNITTGSNNIAIGSNAAVPTAAASNQVKIGDWAISYAGIQVAWTITSDERWKSQIHDVPYGLDFINELRPVSYVRNNSPTQKEEYGFIAQDVEQVFASHGDTKQGMLTKTDAGYLELRYNDFIAPIVRSIQEISDMIHAHTDTIKSHDTEIEKLKSENDMLRSRLDAIEAQLAK